MINSQKSREEGYSIPTRWGTLRDDLKSEYRAEAERMFREWKEDEEKTQRNRDDILKDVKIRKVGE
jgi:hypothetical protein